MEQSTMSNCGDLPLQSTQESVNSIISFNTQAILKMRDHKFEDASCLFGEGLRKVEELLQDDNACMFQRPQNEDPNHGANDHIMVAMPRLHHIGIQPLVEFETSYHVYTHAIAVAAPEQRSNEDDLVSLDLLIELLSFTLHFNIGLALHLSAFCSERNNREYLLNQALVAYEMATTEHDICWDSTHPLVQGLQLVLLNNRGHIYHQYLDSEMDNCLETMESLLNTITCGGKNVNRSLLSFYQNVFHNCSKHTNKHLAPAA